MHNLDRMSGSQRREFMSSCSGKVCVAYTMKIPVRHRGLTAASLAVAALVSLPAAADPLLQSPTPDDQQLPNCDDVSEIVVTGGVMRGDQAEWVDDGNDAPPPLPTIEDDGR